jgi:hypothetical protein
MLALDRSVRERNRSRPSLPLAFTTCPISGLRSVAETGLCAGNSGDCDRVWLVVNPHRIHHRVGGGLDDAHVIRAVVGYVGVATHNQLVQVRFGETPRSLVAKLPVSVERLASKGGGATAGSAASSEACSVVIWPESEALGPGGRPKFQEKSDKRRVST